MLDRGVGFVSLREHSKQRDRRVRSELPCSSDTPGLRRESANYGRRQGLPEEGAQRRRSDPLADRCCG